MTKQTNRINITKPASAVDWKQLSALRKKYLNESEKMIPKLRKILGDVISNQVQFSPQGSVLGISIRYKTYELEDQIISALKRVKGVEKNQKAFIVKMNGQDVLVTFGIVNRNP